MKFVEKILIDYLHNILQGEKRMELDLKQLPEELRAFGAQLQKFASDVQESIKFAESVSAGKLSIVPPAESNKVAAPIERLHNMLENLTTQFEKIAQNGRPSSQGLSGDILKSFEQMTEELKKRNETLLREIEDRQIQLDTLTKNKSLYEMLVGQIEQWIIVMDASTGEWMFISREVDDVLADSGHESQLRRWLVRQMEQMQGEQATRTADLELTGDDGVQYYSVSIHPLHWHERRAFVFVLTDVSKEREQLHTLQNIANYDTLTQVYSRRYGMELMKQWLVERKEFVLCFVDIDNLKYANDRFGHTEGDQYIMLIANILREFSSDAIVSRIGGDEFMLLIENWNADAVSTRLEALRNRLSTYNRTPGALYDHSMSYGVIGVGTNNKLHASDLLSAADEKMYEYKRAYKMRRRKTRL